MHFMCITLYFWVILGSIFTQQLPLSIKPFHNILQKDRYWHQPFLYIYIVRIIYLITSRRAMCYDDPISELSVHDVLLCYHGPAVIIYQLHHACLLKFISIITKPEIDI